MKEKELFIELCSYKTNEPDRLKDLLPENATPAVLGHLFFNRMQGIAYGTLKENHLLGLVNREFRNSLQGAYYQNIERNKNYFACLKQLIDILTPCRGQYALLKGAVLGKLYPEGYRTASDIDLLVRPSDVTEIGAVLSRAGFRQGHIRGSEFVPAARQEIIESKMMRGETVPYIKEINHPFFKFLEVDINYSLDFKNSATLQVDSMLEQVGEVTIDGLNLITLSRYDFFIHLCGHLYKEATTLPWVKMKRDMSLYKFMDIYLLLQDLTAFDLQDLYARAKKLDMAEICSFAILWTAALLPLHNDAAVYFARQELAGKEEILNTVISPQEHKSYIFTEPDLKVRFFAANRMQLLKEVESCEN